MDSMSEGIEEPTLFHMFSKWSKLSVFRGVEPSLRLRYDHKINCDINQSLKCQRKQLAANHQLGQIVLDFNN